MSTNFQLINVDPDEIEDLLVKIEKSLGLHLASDTFEGVTTFGKLCDVIEANIKMEDVDDCTSQQAFYKFKKAVLKIIPDVLVTPGTPMKTILPARDRRLKLKLIESELGYKLSLLRAPHWLTGSFLFAAFVSFIALFLKWEAGFIGLIASVSAIKIANLFGNVLDLQTVGDVALKMMREHYLLSRRNAQTVNKDEIRKLIRDWFSDELGLEESELGGDAKFC